MTQTLNIKRQLAIILRYCYSTRRSAQNLRRPGCGSPATVCSPLFYTNPLFPKNLVWY